MSQTMTQTAMYRTESEAGPSTQGMGATLSDSAAFGAMQQQLPPPLQKLSFAGARDERIISGANRHKYFRRPIIPFMNAQPPEVLFAPTEPEAVGALELPEPEPEPLTKDAECQSMYRESETQTNPYTPDYVLPPDAPEPEVLTLTDLTYGAGLPAGLNEVRMIERARQKREFEASLPPMTDEQSLGLRRKMMGEQELRDWNVREEQILEVQNEKLAAFDGKLRERANEREAAWDERIEHQRQIKLTEKDKEISQIQRRRIKALRKLSEARKHVEAKKEPRDVVAECAPLPRLSASRLSPPPSLRPPSAPPSKPLITKCALSRAGGSCSGSSSPHLPGLRISPHACSSAVPDRQSTIAAAHAYPSPSAAAAAAAALP